MIIDLILDRKENDALISEGYEFAKDWNGNLVSLKYDAKKFYWGVMRYVGGCGGAYAEKIASAMDGGEEEDVKKALCEYVVRNEYNPEICEYVNGVSWLD